MRLPWTARRTGWIGVDLGRRSLKLAQVERMGDEWRLRHGVIVRRDDDRLGEWTAADLRRALLPPGAFAGKEAAAVFSMSQTDLQVVAVPQLPQHQWAIVASELAARSDGDPTHRTFDFWLGEPTPPRESDLADEPADIEVHALSLSNDTAWSLTRSLAETGCRCEVIDGLPTALVRASWMAGESSEEPVAVLDWSDSGASFVVARNNRPVFVRSLRDCGVGTLGAKAAEALGLSPDETEGLLSEFGLLDPEETDTGDQREVQQVVMDLTVDVLRHLLDQLGRTLEYLTARQPDWMPERILLTGGGAAIRNAGELISWHVGLDVVPWSIGTGPRWKRGLPIGPFAAAAGLSALGCLGASHP